MNPTKQSPITYEALVAMPNGEKAVELLFKRAQEDFISLYREMAEHETVHQIYKKKFDDQETVFDPGRIKYTEDLYTDTCKILGKDKAISSHENIFFDPLLYKFVADHKHFHPNLKS